MLARVSGGRMARHRNGLGPRKHVRVELYKPGFLIPAPEAPWIECLILDVSDSGVCLEVGALAPANRRGHDRHSLSVIRTKPSPVTRSPLAVTAT